MLVYYHIDYITNVFIHYNLFINYLIGACIFIVFINENSYNSLQINSFTTYTIYNYNRYILL